MGETLLLHRVTLRIPRLTGVIAQRINVCLAFGQPGFNPQHWKDMEDSYSMGQESCGKPSLL